MTNLEVTFSDVMAALDVPLWILGYIVGGFVLRWILHLLIKRFVDRIVSGVKKRKGADDTQELIVKSPLAAVRTVQRSRTIGSLLTNVVTVIIVIVVTVLIIAKIDPGVLASLSILSAAIGAGLGFGAQRIVGDILNGLFMVMEDQLGVGDEVDMEHATGIVEKVGIRVTQVRDVYGMLWFVRNGEVARVGNNSQGWNRAVIDLAVPYELDRTTIEQHMLEAAIEVYNDPEWGDLFFEQPSIWGLETISAEAVVIRMVAKTKAGSRWAVQRELRARIQERFKQNDIELPPLNTIVFNGPNGIPNDVRPFDPKNPEPPATDKD